FNTDETAYYAPYNMLLCHLFGTEGPYQIAPQYRVPTELGRLIDFATLLKVQVKKRPAFFIEVKSPEILANNAKCKEADRQMCSRFDELQNCIVTPQLPGISAIGTHLAFYFYDASTDSVYPSKIPDHPTLVKDTAPVEWWDCDLLEPEGATRFQEVVDRVKAMCQEPTW
ncbi:hypothetical protein AN958_05874, partial [Leucoagaricus sp. SymC.cos]